VYQKRRWCQPGLPHEKRRAPEPAPRDEKIQERLIAECARISGVVWGDAAMHVDENL
jgi:hypothetical protein